MSDTVAAPMAPAIQPTAPAPAPAPVLIATPSKPHIFPTIDATGREVDPLGRVRPRENVADLSERNEDSEDEDTIPFDGSAPKSKAKPPADDDSTEPEARSPEGTETRGGKPSSAKDQELEAQSEQSTNNPFDVPTTAPKRDYSQLPPEIQAIAKKLPNQVYAKLVDTWKGFDTELKSRDTKIAELEQKVASPEKLIDNPNAFRLDPQFEQIQSNHDRLSLELEHYTEQLSNIEQGLEWEVIEGYDKSGNPVTKKMPAPEAGIDHRAKAQLFRVINQGESRKQQLEAEAQQLQRQYSTAAAEVTKHFDDVDNRFFSDVDLAKLTPDEKQVTDLYLNTLPRAIRGQRATQTQLKFAVKHVRLINSYNKLVEENKRLKGVESVTRAAAPTKVERTTKPLADLPDDEEIPFYPAS